jgi:DNA-binding response OmpR family regulator
VTPANGAQPDTTLAGVTVLIVDDEPVVRAAMEDILAVFGARVHCAGSVAEGTAVAARLGGGVDAVVVDLGLRNPSTGTVLKPWAAACPGAALRVVSGTDRLEAERRLEADVGCALLLKPFSAGDLVAALESVLAARRSGRGDGREHHSS